MNKAVLVILLAFLYSGCANSQRSTEAQLRSEKENIITNPEAAFATVNWNTARSDINSLHFNLHPWPSSDKPRRGDLLVLSKVEQLQNRTNHALQTIQRLYREADEAFKESLDPELNQLDKNVTFLVRTIEILARTIQDNYNEFKQFENELEYDVANPPVRYEISVWTKDKKTRLCQIPALSSIQAPVEDSMLKCTSPDNELVIGKVKETATFISNNSDNKVNVSIFVTLEQRASYEDYFEDFGADDD